jgi:pilus assembly protein CpaF
MLSACGMVIDDTMPSVVGYLDKNIRISVDKAPIVDTDVGINASIRIINQQTVTREKLLNSGSATEEMLDFLNACIRYGVSVCIAGATGSGKTTIMAWLLSRVPYNRRLITLEEGSREFSLIVKDENGKTLNSVVHLLTRPHENPQLNIDQGFLLERILRKHPDVIGVGEMRSSREALAAAEASRTGHTVVTTIHSNSASQTYRRMMTLAKTRNAIDDETLMQIMVEAYPVIVFTKQLEDRSRKITEVIEGEDYTDGKLNFRSLYSFDVTDNITDEHGQSKVIGRHKKIGNISDTLKKRLLDNGISHKELDQFIKEVG